MLMQNLPNDLSREWPDVVDEAHLEDIAIMLTGLAVQEVGDQEVQRRGVLDDNMARAAELQKFNPEAEFGATEFSGCTGEEFAQIFANSQPSNATLPVVDLSQWSFHVEDSKDWVGTAIASVKDQG